MSVYVHACTHADTYIILHSFISRLSIYWYIQTFIHRTRVILGVLYILKKTEGQRIDVFKLWCWRRLLRAPWPAKQSNQSILKDINPEYSLEGLITIAPKHWPPDVKRWLIWKRPWCWEILEAGGEGDNRGCDGLMASLIQWAWVWANSGR